jgi:hypothetical protein
MKISNWKLVMLLAFLMITGGLGISIWGINTDHNLTIWLGISAIVICCVSWWFWVMLVIRTMIQCTEKTQQGLGEIKYDIREVRTMIRDLDSSDKR